MRPVDAFLQSLAAFAAAPLPAEFLAEARARLRELSLAEGQFLAHEEDACQYLPIVASGSLRVYKISETGREITLYRVEPGESCVLTASCLLSDRRFPALACADGPTDVVLTPAELFFRWMSAHEFFRQYVYSITSRRLADVIATLTEVAFGRIDARIAEFLLRHASEASEVRRTHQEIANELGTAREVVSRILKDWEREGLLALGRGDVRILNRDGLAKHAANV